MKKIIFLIFILLILLPSFLIFSLVMLIIEEIIIYISCKRYNYFFVKKSVVYILGYLSKIFINCIINKEFNKQDNFKILKKNSYFLISNHISFLDCLIILSLIYKYNINLKFLVKKNIFWQIPILGQILYFLNFPFLLRNKNNKDLLELDNKCSKNNNPQIIIIFPEGSRISHNKIKNSYYKNLLNAKSGGLYFLFNKLKIYNIIDFTIIYYYKISLLNIFLPNKKIITHIKRKNIVLNNEMLKNRKRFNNWLNALWYKKDRYISSMKKNFKHT